MATGLLLWPRWFACAMAWVGGYFWLPCPSCGEPFAGFEAGMGCIKDATDAGKGWIVCSKERCERAALASWGNGPMMGGAD